MRENEDPACHPSEVGLRLEATRPVVWKGDSELPHLNFPSPQSGLVLVVDLWSGLGSLTLALVSLGVQCIVLSVEQDKDLRIAQAKVLADAVHLSNVEDVEADMLQKVLTKRNFSAIVLGGGAPCQGNSSLNKARKGLADARSLQPRYLQQLATAVRAMTATPVFTLLENVASSPTDVVAEYSHLMGSIPLLISAALWGYIERRRYFWLTGPAGGLNTKDKYKLPSGFSVAAQEGIMALQAHKAKAWPQDLRLEYGFHLTFHPDEVLKHPQEGHVPVHPGVQAPHRLVQQS